MCWSEGASLVMVGAGTVATVITTSRGETPAIPITLGFFTIMEALQAGGYWVINDCNSAVNQSVALLSYLHISVQPLFINAFAMAVAPALVSPAVRRLVFALAGLATLLMLLRLVPFSWAGQCEPGDVLCGPALCVVSGNWHIAWEVPLNDMWRSYGWFLGEVIQFPAYILSVFVLPLVYGAWRFVFFHALLGPILAKSLTDNPNEMPAIWCLFSIGLLLVALSPVIRTQLLGSRQLARP